MAWPPQVGEILPRVEGAVGIRRKLTEYSLNTTHPDGGPKARGIAIILGITSADIGYLEAGIRAEIREAPIATVWRDSPYGVKCVVEFPLQGLGDKSARKVNLSTT